MVTAAARVWSSDLDGFLPDEKYGLHFLLGISAIILKTVSLAAVITIDR